MIDLTTNPIREIGGGKVRCHKNFGESEYTCRLMPMTRRGFPRKIQGTFSRVSGSGLGTYFNAYTRQGMDFVEVGIGHGEFNCNTDDNGNTLSCFGTEQ